MGIKYSDIKLYAGFILFTSAAPTSKIMIEVFKTDVKGIRQAKKLMTLLMQHCPVCRINFDLEDCDKVLRVEGKDFCVNHIIELLKLNGHNCEVLN